MPDYRGEDVYVGPKTVVVSGVGYKKAISKESLISGLFRDLAEEKQPDIVKRYIRSLINQLEKA